MFILDWVRKKERLLSGPFGVNLTPCRKPTFVIFKFVSISYICIYYIPYYEYLFSNCYFTIFLTRDGRLR